MTTFVLIHGGAQGAWCWERLVPQLLGAPGVDGVVAVDLPGHGENRIADHRHIGLQHSVRSIVDATIGNGLSNVVLVGHAMGAIAVIEAAPLLADRLARIVFLAGMVPSEGMSADATLATRFDGAPSQWEQIAATPEREVYGADMDDATADWFFAHLTPAEDRPYLPPRTAVHVSRLPADVPVTYIVQTRDQSFAPDLQRRMLANLRRPEGPSGPRQSGIEVLEIDAGRNSMITRPAESASLLLRHGDEKAKTESRV